MLYLTLLVGVIRLGVPGYRGGKDIWRRLFH